jgi:hypothetical protein
MLFSGILSTKGIERLPCFPATPPSLPGPHLLMQEQGRRRLIAAAWARDQGWAKWGRRAAGVGKENGGIEAEAVHTNGSGARSCVVLVGDEAGKSRSRRSEGGAQAAWLCLLLSQARACCKRAGASTQGGPGPHGGLGRAARRAAAAARSA